MNKPVVALVLSGGAALGFAHVGVIEELIKNNIKIDIVVGTSMGAVVGAGFASGLTTHELINSSVKMNRFKFFDLNFKAGGFFKGVRIQKLLKSVYKVNKIENCEIKFACVATNIKDGKEYILNRGNLVKAVMASMCMPGFFLPVRYNGTILIDGGFVNNFPDDVAKRMGADIIIGVDVIKNFDYLKKHPKNPLDAVMNSIDISINKINALKPKYANIIIEPKQNNIYKFSFKKDLILKSIEYGRVAASSKIDEIKRVINSWIIKK